MTDTTIDAVMPSIEVDGEPTTENIHLGYKWLINFLVTEGKDVSPIGYAGELVTPAEYAVLQQAHPGIPAGPYQPEPQPPADPVIPDGATQAQIQQANRRNTEAKERYKQRCNVIKKAKAHWISSCSPEHLLFTCRRPNNGQGARVISDAANRRNRNNRQKNDTAAKLCSNPS